MYCQKCGKEVKDNDAYCFHCGNPLKNAKKTSPFNYIRGLGIRRKYIAIVLVVICALGLICVAFGGNGKTDVIPTYFAAIEEQSFEKIRKVVQPEIAEQISARASEPITRRMLGEVVSISYDVGAYSTLTSAQIKDLEAELWDEYDVEINISKAYSVPVSVTFMDSVGDKKTYDGDVMYVYKSGGKWYVVPIYSRGR